MTESSSHSQHAIGRERLLGHLAGLAFAAVIAGSYSLGAMAAPWIGPLAINAMRFAIGTAILGVVVVAVSPDKRLALPAGPWRLALLGALMAAYFTALFVALGLASPVATGAVFTLTPLMTAGFALIVLGQRTRPVVLLSLLIAAAGAVWVVFRGDVGAIIAFDVGRGEIIFFFGCMAHALYTPLVRRFRRGEPIIVFTFWTLAATTVWVGLVGASEIAATDWLSLPLIVWITIGYTAGFATALGFFLLQFATVRIPAAKAMAYGYMTPVFIILIEGLIGHGWASPAVLAGALFTVGGLVVLWLAADT